MRRESCTKKRLSKGNAGWPFSRSCSSGDAVATTNRLFCARTRRIAPQRCRNDSATRQARTMDGQRSTIRREHSTMPTNPQDLEGWLSERNCELLNAMEYGDVGLVALIGGLVGQGATQLGLGRPYGRRISFCSDVRVDRTK